MSFNAKDMTQGGQIANMRFRMFGQIANIIFYVLFILFWVLCGLMLMYRLSWQTFVNGCVYWWCTTLGPMRDIIRSQPVYTIQYYGQSLEYTSEQILADKYTIWCGEQLWTSFVFAAVVSLVICIVTFFIASWVLGRQGKQQSEDENTGGRQLSDKPFPQIPGRAARIQRVEEKIEKTAISIRAVLTNYVKAIRYLQGIEKNGEPFTIRDWMRGVREDRPNGWLFISSNADTHASLKPVISMWLSIAIRGLLAMGENRNRRVWIFADELPTLHKLPDLVEILPEARKFGGCYVFGIQSYAQLEDIYGVKPAATLFDVMNTRAFFRSPSREIAEFAAGEIGEKEILKASEQYSYGADPVRDGVSTGKEKERETLVSYSDIQTLPDLSCYVTLPGPYPAVKLALKYKPRPKIAEGFIPRTLDARVDARLSALLEAREAEGSLARALFTPDTPEPGPADTNSHAGEQPEPVSPPAPAVMTVTPAPVKSPPTTKRPAAEPSVRATEPPVLRGTTVPLIKPKAAAAATAASTASSAGAPAAAAGGTEQELAQQSAEQGQDMLPAGMNEDGVIEDMQAYDAWLADEQTQRDMQRREEVNINHSHRHDEQDDVEIGGNF
ncbi:type IV secretion system DNA-binding domain-containing protein [Klebsiella pneumoniae]